MLTKLYGRPRAGVLEGQLVVALADVLDPRVERMLGLAADEKRRVHDHAVADRLVRARGDRHVAQRLENLGDVALGPCLQRRIDQPSVLHAREVGRALLRRDLPLQTADVLVLFLDLADDLVAVPQHLQPELELVLHLVEDVDERVVGRTEQLDDVVVGLEHRAERHRDDRVLLHHGLVDALVREDVVARRILHDHRRPGDHRRDVAIVDRAGIGRIGADAERPERQRFLRLDDAVDVLAFVAFVDRPRLGARRLDGRGGHTHAVEPAARSLCGGRATLAPRRGGRPLRFRLSPGLFLCGRLRHLSASQS